MSRKTPQADTPKTQDQPDTNNGMSEITSEQAEAKAKAKAEAKAEAKAKAEAEAKAEAKAKAEAQLRDLKTFIIGKKPVNYITHTDDIKPLTPSKDAKKIKYFKIMNQSIKDKFKEHQDLDDDTITLAEKGPTGSGTIVGTEWHNTIKAHIDEPEGDHPVGKAVIDALKTKFLEMEFFQSEFPLYGYMVNKEDSKVSLWNGHVDAIGWYDNNYVIVDWKVVDLLKFWDRNKDAFGKYLHQCLVYAQLLKLHLNLSTLPYILIVPINQVSGNQILPGLFLDFPPECKEELDQYDWSVEEPKRQTLCLTRSKVISAIKHLVHDSGIELCCTVDELLKALGFEE